MGGWGGGGGGGQKEKKGDTARKRGRKRAWKREGRGKKAKETRQKNAEKGVSQRKSVCTMCWGVIMRRAWDKITALLYPSDRLQTQISSLGANTLPSFDICFPF